MDLILLAKARKFHYKIRHRTSDLISNLANDDWNSMNTSKTRGVAKSSLRNRALVAGALVTALALAACGGGPGKTEAETPKPGESSSSAPETPAGAVDPDAIIEAGLAYSLGTGFDPMTTTGALTVAANWHTLEGLTELDPVTREVYAALGAEMPTQVDGTTYTVKLREGAVFHDGSPVTVDDVLFSFERVLDPANESLYAGFIDFLDSVEKVDDQTVQLNTKYEFSLVAERISVVKIVPKAVVEADAEAFNALPTGTGPYVLKTAVADDKLTFDRFDDYTGPRPAQAAGMVWNLLSDSAARVTALQSGTVQAIESVPYIDLPSVETSQNVESVQSFGLLFMMFNTQTPPFDDVRVRQAFFYALDMDKIINTGLFGNAEAATGFLPASHPNYNKASTVYTYDPEKSKELLADAGVPNMNITLLTTDTDWVGDLAPLIKEDLDAVGISTTLDIGQSGSQYAKVDAGDFEVMVAPGDPSVFGNDPDLLMRWWYGDNIWSQERHRWAKTDDFKKFIDILDRAVKTSGEEQQTLWNESFDMLSDEVPLYPLFHRQLPTAWSDDISGFKPIGLTGMSFLDAGIVK